MGRRKIKEKTPADLQAERVETALEETDRTGRAPVVVRENPGQFLRDMYEVWHRQGGKEGGRWRNSIRKMRDEWLVGRNAVPSLHPKLMGRVKLTRSDVRALLDLFLTRWSFEEADGLADLTIKGGYIGFPSSDPRHLRRVLLDSIAKTSDRTDALLLPERGEKRNIIEETQRRWSNIENVLRQSDVLITLSRHKIAVGSKPWQTISNTWHLFNELYEYDQSNNREKRLLIWAIDLGNREVGDLDDFMEYFNAGLLALQLASFSKFDVGGKSLHPYPKSSLPNLTVLKPQRRDDLWHWLTSRSVIAVQNMRLEEIERLHGEEEKTLRTIRLKDIGITPEHILPSATPRAWSQELRQLYGKEIDASDATFTVFMRDEPWAIAGQFRTHRYFAHTPVETKQAKASLAQVRVERITRSEELKSPDARYDDAFRLIYWGARFRLGQTESPNEGPGLEAIAYLRRIGFTMLSVTEFLSLFSN